MSNPTFLWAEFLIGATFLLVCGYRAWRAGGGFWAGVVAMYLTAGCAVTLSMWLSTKGCPWWLPPYWVVTWLIQVLHVIKKLVIQ